MRNLVKKIVMLTIVLFAAVLVGLAPDAWAAESGTEPEQHVDGYYLIGTKEELIWFASQVNSGRSEINGRLTADIALNDETFEYVPESGMVKVTGADGSVLCNLER